MARRLNPFEPGINLEERQDRIRGGLLHLVRETHGQRWLEDLTVSNLRSYDETSGIITLFALVGRAPRDFDPYRESGQCRTIHIDEIQNNNKEVRNMSTATKTKKASKAKPATKAKATKAKATKAKPAVKGNRHEKREKALALHKKGTAYKEIAKLVDFANPGAAWNAVKAAKDAEAK